MVSNVLELMTKVKATPCCSCNEGILSRDVQRELLSHINCSLVVSAFNIERMIQDIVSKPIVLESDNKDRERRECLDDFHSMVLNQQKMIRDFRESMNATTKRELINPLPVDDRHNRFSVNTNFSFVEQTPLSDHNEDEDENHDEMFETDSVQILIQSDDDDNQSPDFSHIRSHNY